MSFYHGRRKVKLAVRVHRRHTLFPQLRAHRGMIAPPSGNLAVNRKRKAPGLGLRIRWRGQCRLVCCHSRFGGAIAGAVGAGSRRCVIGVRVALPAVFSCDGCGADGWARGPRWVKAGTPPEWITGWENVSRVVLLLDGSLACSFGPGPCAFVEHSLALHQAASTSSRVLNGSIVKFVALLRKLLLTKDFI